MTKQEWILKVIESFYDKAKTDVLIGYHFRIIEDFESHIPRIVAFWELQLLGQSEREISGSFDIVKVHLPLGIKKGELGRWIVLFRKTLDEKTSQYPEMKDLKELWITKIQFFEGIFSRFLGL